MTGSHPRRRAAARWLPAIAWMVVIFALSSISGLRVSEEVEVDRPIRALAHLASYAFLAGLVLYGVSGPGPPSRRELVLAFLIAVLYGSSDEIHQAYVPTRNGRAGDLFIDTFGAVIGLAIAAPLLIRWARTTSRGGDDTRAGVIATSHESDG